MIRLTTRYFDEEEILALASVPSGGPLRGGENYQL